MLARQVINLHSPYTPMDRRVGQRHLAIVQFALQQNGVIAICNSHPLKIDSK